MKQKLKLALSALLILQGIFIGFLALSVSMTDIENQPYISGPNYYYLRDIQWLSQCTAIDRGNEHILVDHILMDISPSCQLQPSILVASGLLASLGLVWAYQLLKKQEKK